MRTALLIAAAAAASAALTPAARAAPPAVSVAATPGSGAAPLTSTLQATGDPATYHWTFGDGATADGPIVRHTWARAGRYAVHVVATGESGESAIAEVVVTAYRLTLSAPAVARYGAPVTLRGRLTPAARGSVAVRLGRRVVAAPRLRPNGRFRVVTRLARSGPWTAQAAGVRTQPVSIVVRPVLAASLVGIPVVGAPVSVHARVRPAGAGPVTITIGRRKQRTFAGAATFAISSARPQVIRVTLRARAAPGYAQAAKTIAFAIRVATLERGARGPSVVYLQRRLLELHYALRSVSGTFGDDTYEAVIAFEKTVGLPRDGRVDERLWGALLHAHIPMPRVLSGTHIEVDKTRQLLFQVAGGRVIRIIGVSTGATGNTPVGMWHVYRKVPGWDWVLWYPLYFLRGFAVHGYPDVPPFPASHGCVRIPMWLAPSLYATYGYGTLVVIY